MTTKRLSRLADAVLETADDMHRIGLLDGAAHQTITLRHLGNGSVGAADPISGAKTRDLREGLI